MRLAENWLAALKRADVRRRIAFTLAALVVLRVGAFIPLPGLDPAQLAQLMTARSGGSLGTFSLASGGAVERLSIFALGISPIITAWLIVELVMLAVPRLRARRAAGQLDPSDINQWLRSLALALAAVQALGIAIGLQSITGSSGGARAPLVPEPGLAFRAGVVVSLVAATVFLIWLSEQITKRGVGNGLSVMLMAISVVGLTRTAAAIYATWQAGAINSAELIATVAGAALLVAVVVAFERARRRLPISYAQQPSEPRSADAPMREPSFPLNVQAEFPPVLAPIVLSLALTLLIGLAGIVDWSGGGWMPSVIDRFRTTGILYWLAAGAFTVVLACLFAAERYDTRAMAADLQSSGGTVDGVAPGADTERHLDRLLARTTLFGALLVALATAGTGLMQMLLDRPIWISGTWLLVAVCVFNDVLRRLEAATDHDGKARAPG